MARKFIITVNNEEYEVLVEEVIEGKKLDEAPIKSFNNNAPIQIEEAAQKTTASAPQKRSNNNSKGHSIVAPLPGVVLNILVKPGEKVTPGQTVLILEAMKMENEINSPVAGTVASILVNTNQNINTNDLLIIVE